MKINAKFNRITDLETFVASWQQTGGRPTVGFRDFGPARVHLATDFPDGSFSDNSSFIPNLSFKTDADAKGNFSFDIADGLKKFRGRLLAYRRVGTVQPHTSVPPMPIFEAVYRSEIFPLSDVKDALRNIFLFQMTTENEKGYSQGQADDDADRARGENGFDRVTFTVREHRISCRVSARGAEVRFNARLRGSTSHLLTQFVSVEAEDIDIDLPGPDAIVGICISKEDIERRIRGVVRHENREFNRKIEGQIPALLKSLASFTVHRIRYPVTGEKTFMNPHVPDPTVPTLSAVPDLTIGVPRALY